MLSKSASAVAFAVTVLAAAASNAAAAEPFQPVQPCASLGTLDLTAVNARVESAAETTTDGIVFCQVKGYISPQTHYTVLLPQQTWRGSYLQQGCGGFCGHDDVSLAGSGALWAIEDPMLRVVFGYRSGHDLAVTAKAIIGAFYGRTPAYSYFNGVSDGGREALALAQQLFNGGEPYGSEISWQGWITTAANDPGYPASTIAGGLALDYLRYVAFWTNPPSSLSLQNVDFSLDAYQRLQPMRDIYDATDADLRAFRARGGKLIL
jgi:hypothetical protein